MPGATLISDDLVIFKKGIVKIGHVYDTGFFICSSFYFSSLQDKPKRAVAVAVPGWLAWGNWSQCTASCGQGTKLRGRLCSHQAINGKEQCEGNAFEFADCTMADCPGDFSHTQDKHRLQDPSYN